MTRQAKLAASLLIPVVCVCQASASPDPNDVARLTGVWRGQRTMESKGSDCRLANAGQGVGVRLTFDVKADGSFEAVQAMAPDYKPLPTHWHGQLGEGGRVDAVVPATAVCRKAKREYSIFLRGRLVQSQGEVALQLTGQDLACPPTCIFERDYKLKPE